ncbi:glycosyltransferase family 2 protein [Halobacillus litoralis]|uniref:glycosyltransferase n=1 Tax=Halobacillus litoralis TaxID=45668 RepID=UPI001CFEE288|nr:glycosyltransferase family 2 protein [Halobacillus litoralis]WLR46346.1 glycosyltransferase family 2 protein [Halobacillus litoralis]
MFLIRLLNIEIFIENGEIDNMFWVFFGLLFVWMILLVDFLLGIRKIPRLEDTVPSQTDELVSVIIAAKDEEDSIRETLHTLAHQKNVRCEIIAVNDRSSDRTGEFIDKTAALYSTIRAVHINHLPEGWLGKNHALKKGAELAAGAYLLFTDADIQFDEQTLSKAMTAMKVEELDHLTAAPDLKARSFALRGLISYFLFGFGYLKRPWTANQKKTRGGMGIGAFQLMTNSCYQKTGTHEAVRFRPDDDLALGQRIKAAGFRQKLVTAKQLLSVEWYPDFKSALQGFEKNAFAGLNYSISLSLFALFGVLFSQVFPFIFVFSGDPSVQIISAINILLLFCLYGLTTRSFTNYPLGMIFGLPIFALLFVFMLGRALILTWVRGGIEWRGNRYSIKELKQFFRNSEEDHR